TFPSSGLGTHSWARAPAAPPLVRARDRALDDHRAGPRLERDDRRARLGTARDQRRPVALAASATSRRGGPEPVAALPGAPLTVLLERLRRERPRPCSRLQRLADDLGGDSGVPARTTRHRPPLDRLPDRATCRLHTVDRLLDGAAHRGRSLPGVPLGNARHA